MRILVTGGNGYIGRHVIDLLRETPDVVVAGLDKTYRKTIGDKQYAVDILNYRELADAVGWFQPCGIVHLAAMASVRGGMVNPHWYLENNIQGTVNVMNAGWMARNIVFASSGGTVYGEMEQGEEPMRVGRTNNPEDVYGISKLTGEHLVRILSKKNNQHWYNLRFPNVYGPGQNPDGEAGVVSIFAKKMLAGKKVVINGDGNQTRDFSYVGDVASWVVHCVTNNYGLNSGAYNVGTGLETSVNDIFNELQRQTGYSLAPVHDKAKEGEVRRVALVPDLKCLTPLSDGIKQVIGWMKEAKDVD
jgi:UDP-glucose 4-epimerase